MFDVATLQETLAVARDAALILLAVEGLLLATLTLLLFRAAVRGLRRLVPRMYLFMLDAQRTTSRVCGSIQRAMALMCAPFVWLNNVSANLALFARRLHAFFGSASPKGR